MYQEVLRETGNLILNQISFTYAQNFILERFEENTTKHGKSTQYLPRLMNNMKF